MEPHLLVFMGLFLLLAWAPGIAWPDRHLEKIRILVEKPSHTRGFGAFLLLLGLVLLLATVWPDSVAGWFLAVLGALYLIFGGLAAVCPKLIKDLGERAFRKWSRRWIVRCVSKSLTGAALVTWGIVLFVS